MAIKNRAVSLAFKIALCAVCFYGLYLNSGIPRGNFKPTMFIFFTILSVLLCFIYSIVSIVKTARDIKGGGPRGTTTVLPRFKGAFIIALLVTFLIYHFLLRELFFTMNLAGEYKNADIFVHYLAPFMLLADWLLFDKKGAFRPYDPVIWAVVPLAYLFFALIRAQVGGLIPGIDSFYPYFFIDVDVYGPQQVFLNVLLFSAFYVGVGYLLFGLDRLLVKYARLSPPVSCPEP